MSDLDINRFLDMYKYPNITLCQKVAEGMKVGGYVCTDG